jgi:hypothetical protein
MFRTRLATAGLVLLLTLAGARAADPAAAKALAPDARGFLHVRVGEVWSSDAAKQLRDFVSVAGPNLIAEFDGRFYPAPSEVESFTVILYDPNFRGILPAGRPTEVTPVWVVTAKKPLDRDALLKTMARTGKGRKHAGKDYHFDEAQWSGLLMLDDRSYAYGSEDAITGLIDRMAKGGDSPLAALLTREADKHPVSLGVSMAKAAGPEAVKSMPPELQPLFKARTLLAALDLQPKTTVSASLEFATEAEAKDGLKATQEVVQLARGQLANALTSVEQQARRDPGKPQQGIQEFPETVGFLLAAAGLKKLDALLGAMPLNQKGGAVQASLELDSVLPGGSTAVSIATVAIAIGASGNGILGARLISSGDYELVERERKLAELARAIDRYRKDKGHYPPPATTGKDGKPLLSWRVAVLPYMENVYVNGQHDGKPINGTKGLYDLFKLDEPWDGPNNKKLIDKMPSPYQAPWNVLPYPQTSIGKTLTFAVAGKGAIFDPTKDGVRDSDVRDGLKQTLLLLALEEPGQAAYWTKPADVALTAGGKLPADGPTLRKRFAVVYADGSAHTLMNGLPEKTFLGIVTRAGDEELDEKEIRPERRKGQSAFPGGAIPPPPPPPPIIK